MIESLQRYGPTKSLPVLVAELNQLYHEHESVNYEFTHPEIFEQLPTKWLEMANLVDSLGLGEQGLRILDFGCGTGFEARECLENFPARRVQSIVCYDPSEHMLDRCRRTLDKWRGKTEFVTSLEGLLRSSGKFNLFVTNSVLHHLVEPVRTIREIEPLLSPEAIWLCGHEPSRRFFGNPECRAVLRQYRASERWRRLLSPKRYSRRLLRWAGLAELSEDYAARRAFEKAMFRRRPPGRLVGEIVDFHVIDEESELVEERGLDFRQLQEKVFGEWDLLWWRTYSYMGPHYEGRLPARWQRAARTLASSYPDDGGNCCMVWRRAKGKGW